MDVMCYVHGLLASQHILHTKNTAGCFMARRIEFSAGSVPFLRGRSDMEGWVSS